MAGVGGGDVGGGGGGDVGCGVGCGVVLTGLHALFAARMLTDDPAPPLLDRLALPLP